VYTWAQIYCDIVATATQMKSVCALLESVVELSTREIAAIDDLGPAGG